jgi:hypothetical protein
MNALTTVTEARRTTRAAAPARAGVARAPARGRKRAVECSVSAPNLFLVGRNSRGIWVARDQSGRCGGLFVGCAPAVKFALSENGNRREDIVMVAGPLELDIAAPRFLSAAS